MAGDLVEFCSVKAATANAQGRQLSLTVLRGRLGYDPRAATVPRATVWLVRTADLLPQCHKLMKRLGEADNPSQRPGFWWSLVPFNVFTALSEDDVDRFLFQFPKERPYAPKIIVLGGSTPEGAITSGTRINLLL